MTISTLYEERSGVGAFVCGGDFSLLDEAIQSRFQPTGAIEYDYEGNRNEVYSDGDIQLWLGTESTLNAMAESSNYINGIVVLSDKYCTDRGLRVGDSEEKFLSLYGDDDMGFDVEISEGKITKIMFNPADSINYNYGNQLGIEDFVLTADFNLLDQDTQNRFQSTGRVEYEAYSNKNEIYSDGNIELSVRTGSASYEPIITSKEIVKIVVISDQYCTDRGLRVGDSEEKFLALYHDKTMENNFQVEIEDGVVTNIIFSCP